MFYFISFSLFATNLGTKKNTTPRKLCTPRKEEENYSWQENHQGYGHIRCIYTVLANPNHKEEEEKQLAKGMAAGG